MIQGVIRKTAVPCLVVALAWLGAGCGYTLQNSRSRELEKEGIRKIFVAPLVNNTYKSGVENVVYNSLLKSLSGNHWILLVHSPADADAVLQGTVDNAQFIASASVTGDKLNGATLIPVDNPSRFSSIQVATEYTSTLGCTFSLLRRNPPPGKKLQVWGASFSRSKPFPASNQLGTLGETSALINESEFDRTLAEMAGSMMTDVRESMLARF